VKFNFQGHSAIQASLEVHTNSKHVSHQIWSKQKCFQHKNVGQVVPEKEANTKLSKWLKALMPEKIRYKSTKKGKMSLINKSAP